MTSSILKPWQIQQPECPGPALQRTPQAKGTAVINEHLDFVGTQVHNIRRWIRQDVKELKNIPVDQMLKEILVDCGEPGQSFDEDAKTSLLTDCLQKVLPFCNGKGDAKMKEIEAKPIEGKKKNKKKKIRSSRIKQNLKKYSALSKAREKELYPLFVEAANTALLFLQELEVECLRGAASDDLICFQVSDPSRLKQGHKTWTSERKPDVIVVSETDIRIREGEFLFDVTARRPGTPLEWRNVRAFVEFKQTTKVKMDSPPKSYRYKPYTAPTPEYLRLQGPEYVQVVMSSAKPQLVLKPGASSHPLGKVMETDSRGRKRTSSDLTLSESGRKRQKHNQQKEDYDPIVQAGDYAAELFSTHAGRLHVFGLIIVGDILYLWRYDREGAIQCSGFNFILDLPRFLVLLLAMQRFNNRDWGLNPYIDPDFGERRPYEMTVTDANDKQITLTLDLSDEHRVTHYGLNGRATNLFSVKSSDLSNDDLVAKVSWPQVARTSEPTILGRVYKIAKDDNDVKGHVPQMLGYLKLEETSTEHIRKRLGLDVTPQSSRVLYMLVFRRLRPIRELVGDDFLRAWWATVKCHLALWKKGVYHKDISDSNLMYYKDDEGNIVGVLNDFDLASTQDTPTASGTQRTGTLPFMASALLKDSEGRKKHLYEHDAESFTWVLTWIALQYSDGAPREDGERPLDGWLGKDAVECRKEKSSFLVDEELWSLTAGNGHERNWELAKDCIRELLRRITDIANSMDHSQTWDTDEAFNTLLQKPYSNLLNV